MPERGIPISDAAKVMGISVDALRKRVQRRSVRAYKGSDGQWRVVVPVPSTAETWRDKSAASETEPPRSSTVFSPYSTPDERFARVIEQALAPYAERLEVIAREAGALRAELDHERDRRTAAERGRDAARGEVSALRMLVRSLERKPAAAPAPPVTPATDAGPTMTDAAAASERGIRGWLRRRLE